MTDQTPFMLAEGAQQTRTHGWLSLAIDHWRQ